MTGDWSVTGALGVRAPTFLGLRLFHHNSVRRVDGGTWVQHGPNPEARRFWPGDDTLVLADADVLDWQDACHARGCECMGMTSEALYAAWDLVPLPAEAPGAA